MRYKCIYIYIYLGLQTRKKKCSNGVSIHFLIIRALLCKTSVVLPCVGFTGLYLNVLQTLFPKTSHPQLHS